MSTRSKTVFTVAGALALITALGAAWASWEIIRPFAYVQEVQAVEQRACENELRAYNTEKRAIVRDQSIANLQENEPWEQALVGQEFKVQGEIERVKRECGWK